MVYYRLKIANQGLGTYSNIFDFSFWNILGISNFDQTWTLGPLNYHQSISKIQEKLKSLTNITFAYLNTLEDEIN